MPRGGNEDGAPPKVEAPASPRPSVASISGEYREDLVTQDELREAHRARIAALRARNIAWEAARQIANRLRLGAKAQPGLFKFDPRRGIVSDPGDAGYDELDEILRGARRDYWQNEEW